MKGEDRTVKDDRGRGNHGAGMKFWCGMTTCEAHDDPAILGPTPTILFCIVRHHVEKFC